MLIKKLYGYSGCQLDIIQEQDKLFVRKHNSNKINLPQLVTLSNNNIRCPEIYDITYTYYDMEYINNVDMKTFLANNSTQEIATFIGHIIRIFENSSGSYKDYTEVYQTKLAYIDQDYYQDLLPFTSSELIEQLPKLLPKSLYHGDLTLDNILYDTEHKEFVLIDAVTSDYDSFVFDLAKLRQDLTCQWFIRNDSILLDQVLTELTTELFDRYRVYFDNNLVIAMLLRVLGYTPKHSTDEQFIIDWIHRLWS